MREDKSLIVKAIKPVLITDLLEGDSSVLDGGGPALLDLGEVQLVPWPQSVKSYNQDVTVFFKMLTKYMCFFKVFLISSSLVHLNRCNFSVTPSIENLTEASKTGFVSGTAKIACFLPPTFHNSSAIAAERISL